MRLRQPGLILKGLQQRDAGIVPGTVLAPSSNEAPIGELYADDAACSHDYEISVWRSSLDIDNRPVPGGRYPTRPGHGTIFGVVLPREINDIAQGANQSANIQSGDS
jgi:hypothetical protein